MSGAIEHNRRAVYTALSGVCDDRLLLERAFGFFETNFATQSVFRVAQYIDGLMGHVGLNQDQRRALSVALYSALNKQDRELSEVPAMFRSTPSVPASSVAAPAAGRAVSMSAPATVLAKVLEEIVSGTTRAGKLDDLIAAIEDAQTTLADNARAVVTEWTQGKLANAQRLAARMQERGHATIVNFVYVALCDAVGPAQADRILGRAIASAEQLSEAADWPPRAML